MAIHSGCFAAVLSQTNQIELARDPTEAAGPEVYILLAISWRAPSKGEQEELK